MSVLFLRMVVGPIFIGLAVWCASGTLATATADSTHLRVALPAPIWIGVAAAALAFVVTPWRRRPLTAVPALLSVLPWLPLPAPAASLIWTGRLAWFPIACAVIAAGLSPVWDRREESSERPSARRMHPGTSAAWAGLLAIIAGGVVFASIGDRLPGGDEPHYLVIAQSLLDDGDLKIENQHTSRAYASWWTGPLPPHYIERGKDGEIYSIHAPGTAVLVAPLFALAGLGGAQITILLLFGLTGAMVWTMAWLLVRMQGAAWIAWSAVVLGATSLVQGVTIFPDGPGAAMTATAVVIWLALRQRILTSPGWWTAASALLAFLPFLHTRFVVLAAAIGVIFVLEIFRRPRDEWWRVTLAFMPLAIVGAVAWFGYFHVIYGTPDPTAPYGPNRESSLAYVPGGVLGLLFDQQFGLLAATPVLAVAGVGWWRARRSARGGDAIYLLPVVLAYFATVATYWMWWAGVPATPARFATAALPLFAAPLAIAWASGSRFLRAGTVTLLTVSVATSMLRLGGGGELTWERRGGRAEWLDALGTAADLGRAWPSFFWRVIGGEVATEWPFAVHTIVTLASIGVVVAVFAYLARATRDTTRRVAAGVLMSPLAAMLAATGGWALNDATGIWPATSQLRILRKTAEGDRPWAIGPFVARPFDGRELPLVVTVPPTTLPTEDEANWAPLEGVPAGTYTIRVTSRRPAGGQVSLHVGSPSVPALVQTELLSQSRHLVPLELGEDAPSLHAAVTGELRRPGTRIELIPVELAAR